MAKNTIIILVAIALTAMHTLKIPLNLSSDLQSFAHLVGFAAFTVLAKHLLDIDKILALQLSIILALVLESLQLNLSYRSFEIIDILADVTGCTIGYILFLHNDFLIKTYEYMKQLLTLLFLCVFTIANAQVDSSALPVDLTSFTASQTSSTITLNWTTASEEINEGFEVQRSTDGENWQKIGFVAGNGTTLEKQEYSFEDIYLGTGVYYYRLKQLDFDGEFEYSFLVQVEFKAKTGVEIIGNLINSVIKVRGEGTIYIYSVIGRLEKTVQLSNDINAIDVSDFSSGVYIVKGIGTKPQRFIKS